MAIQTLPIVNGKEFFTFTIVASDNADGTGNVMEYPLSVDDPEGITIIEWAGIIEEIIPKGTYVVNIVKDLSKGNDYRKITITKTTKEGYLN